MSVRVRFPPEAQIDLQVVGFHYLHFSFYKKWGNLTIFDQFVGECGGEMMINIRTTYMVKNLSLPKIVQAKLPITIA